MRAGEMDLNELPFPLILKPGGPVTDEQLIRFSERNKPFKIEQNNKGEITIMTPVGGIGGTHEFYITSMLFVWVEQDGTGIGFGPNTGFRLADGSCLAPDAAWLSISRWNALTLAQQTSFPPLCPEFIIEVRSQSDPRRLLEAKMELWIENGVQLAWLVDPANATVDIYRANEPVRSLQRPEKVLGVGPLQGFELRTSRLWSPS